MCRNSRKAIATLAAHLCTALAFLLGGCVVGKPANGQPIVDPRSIHFVAVPSGERYTTAVWLQAIQAVVVEIETLAVGPSSAHLYMLSDDLRTATQLELPSNPDCFDTAERFPRPLGDGRLAYIEQCYGFNVNPDQAARLMVWDPTSNADGPLRPYRFGLEFSAFDFDPRADSGIIDGGAIPDDHLFWLGDDRLAPVAVSMDRAHSPRWSPDGTRVVFWGLADAGGKVGPARIGLPGALYLMGTSSDSSLRTLVDGVAYAGIPSWSPDGQWIVVRLDFASQESSASGLWLIEADTGRRYLLVGGGDLGSAAWLPDNHSLVVAVGVSRTPQDSSAATGLDKIDLPDLSTLASRSP